MDSRFNEIPAGGKFRALGYLWMKVSKEYAQEALFNAYRVADSRNKPTLRTFNFPDTKTVDYLPELGQADWKRDLRIMCEKSA